MSKSTLTLFKHWHCPGASLVLLRSEYISHLYAGDNQRIDLAHEIISCYTAKTKNDTFNGGFVGEKLFSPFLALNSVLALQMAWLGLFSLHKFPTTNDTSVELQMHCNPGLGPQPTELQCHGVGIWAHDLPALLYFTKLGRSWGTVVDHLPWVQQVADSVTKG